MNILAIDTSGPVCGVSICKDDRVCYEAAAVNKMTHSVSLMPMVEEALLHSGIPMEQIDLFAAVMGPGSFTGVRIGISAVNALAHAAGKLCIGIDALEAMAKGNELFDGIICPVQDARAGQVYGALFEGGTMKRLCEDEPLKIEDFCEKAAAYGRKMLFMGDGMPVHREKIAGLLGDMAVFASGSSCFLRPSCAALLALQRADEALAYTDLKPLYLRPPQAERQKNLRETGHE